MSNIPSNLKYAKTDEWFDPATGKVGLTDYAQGQLSDIVFMEVTVDVDAAVGAESAIASVESVKAASEVMSPVSGKVVAINESLADAPETINSDPYGEAWFIQLDGGDTSGLMDAAAYEKYCEEREH